MSVYENLIAAKALIDRPDKWAQHEYSPKPSCYCVLGAIAVVHNSEPEYRTFPEDRAIAWELPDGWAKRVDEIADFNDAPNTKHSDIMALFDRAISKAKGE